MQTGTLGALLKEPPWGPGDAAPTTGAPSYAVRRDSVSMSRRDPVPDLASSRSSFEAYTPILYMIAQTSGSSTAPAPPPALHRLVDADNALGAHTSCKEVPEVHPVPHLGHRLIQATRRYVLATLITYL